MKRCHYNNCKTVLAKYNKTNYCGVHRQEMWAEDKPIHGYRMINAKKKQYTLEHRKHIAMGLKLYHIKKNKYPYLKPLTKKDKQDFNNLCNEIKQTKINLSRSVK